MSKSTLAKQVQKRINGVRERYWYKIGGKADPNVPKSEVEKVTPKTTAAAKEDKGLSPVPFSLRKKEKHTTKQLPKAIRCDMGKASEPSEQLANYFDGAVVSESQQELLSE